MKKCLLLLSAMLLTLPAWASQSPDSFPAARIAPLTAGDLAEVMESQGIFIQKYDICSLNDTVSELWIRLDQYFGRDSVVNMFEYNTGPVYKQLTDGSPSAISEITVSCWLKSDSTALISMKVKDRMGITLTARFRKVAPDYEKYTSYDFRPFAIWEPEPGERIPLALYGSWWYDEEVSARSTGPIHRFCGSDELDWKMEDEIFDLSPHYFIFSIRLQKP